MSHKGPISGASGHFGQGPEFWVGLDQIWEFDLGQIPAILVKNGQFLTILASKWEVSGYFGQNGRLTPCSFWEVRSGYKI